jgi:hypothetical protein
VALSVFLAHPVAAQLNGVPIWSPGLPVAPLETAVMVHGATGDDFVGDTDADWGGTWSLRGMFADRVTLTGGLGVIRRDIGVSDRAFKPQYFVSAALHLVHGSDAVGDFEYGVAILSGWGVSTLPGNADEQNAPVGLDLTGRRNMGGWFVQFSLVPHWSWRRTDLGTGGRWQSGPGVSLGATAGTSFGLALVAAADKMWLDATTGIPALPETNPFAWSIGLRWAL